MGEFTLDPRIEADSIPVTELPLSAARLARDACYPWLILVPQRPGLADLIDLAPPDRRQLMDEISLASEALRALVPCEKLNVAALGNTVRQLHVHVIARRKDDAAWPKPIWGAAPATAYPPGEAEALAARIAAQLT